MELYLNYICFCNLYLGLLMVISDGLLLFYIVSGLPDFEFEYTDLGVCDRISSDTSIIIWYGLSDIIIGLYCLLVFVLPLRRLSHDTLQYVHNLLLLLLLLFIVYTQIHSNRKRNF